MSPRGRPTSNPRGDNRVGVRLTKDDVEKLEYVIKVTGLTKTEVIRNGIYDEYQKAIKKNG